MADDAVDTDTQQQSQLQNVATRLEKGRPSRRGQSPSADKAVHPWPENSANAGVTSAIHYAHNLAGSGSSSEAQMRGVSCLVRKLKPSRLGCAIVEFDSHSMREAVMSRAEQFPIMNDVPRMEIHGETISVRRHIDKYGTTLMQEKLTGIFISWSHGVEKHSPLPLIALVEAFDTLVAQVEAPNPSSLPVPRFVL
eukprot:TRINITY_DN804_c0_g2_i2.p1 TRINITY_DN804_c0_g2~~TRINITY_DN804_c0_g2_i2.p1  ORF type:complete len:195 (-),score=26.85 TRINITY_DN804_c0_g2_i2:381-965(-)